MKIALINGSPKTKNSASGILLEDLKSHLSQKAEITEIKLQKTFIPEEIAAELKTMEALVFSFPLYVDGIPAHLLSCLIQLENAHWQNREIYIYGIVNCGFHEGVQAKYALEILQNWCKKTELIWGGGIGAGGGGGLANMPSTKNGHGPKAPIDKALQAMADKILQNKRQKNHYVSVAFPRFLYRIAAQIGWRQMIKANGGKTKDLGKRPEEP